MENSEHQHSVIGPTVTVRGELTARAAPLTITGSVEGLIDHDETLYIEKHSTLTADVHAREIHVGGTVKGNVYATERVHIHAGGSVQGDIYTNSFAVEEGARIRGSVIMEADAETVHRHFEARRLSMQPAKPALKVSARHPTQRADVGRSRVDHRKAGDGDGDEPG